MTMIVQIKTKKLLKEKIKNGLENEIYIQDPSMFGGISGFLPEVLKHNNNSITVTNHPKRSWFANIKFSDVKNKIIVA